MVTSEEREREELAAATDDLAAARSGLADAEQAVKLAHASILSALADAEDQQRYRVEWAERRRRVAAESSARGDRKRARAAFWRSLLGRR